MRFSVGITISPYSSTHALLSSIPSKLYTMSTDSLLVDAANISNEKVPSLVNKSIEIQLMNVPSNNLSLCRSTLNEDHVENVMVAQVIYLKQKSN